MDDVAYRLALILFQIILPPVRILLFMVVLIFIFIVFVLTILGQLVLVMFDLY